VANLKLPTSNFQPLTVKFSTFKSMEEELRYPIGHFKAPYEYTRQILQEYISEIELFPRHLKMEVAHLNKEQLDTMYRPGGWTIRQVVNHMADSHMNALIRVKLALTEEKPVIKPYAEQYWAELPDAKEDNIQPALAIVEQVHHKWVLLLRSFTEKEWQRGYIHPEKGREVLLNESAGSYAWHCRHHLAHITRLKARNGWK
jgi:hypothetical protein